MIGDDVMKTSCDDSLPRSSILLDIQDKHSWWSSPNKNAFVQPKLLSDLHELTYSVKDRLLQAKRIIYKHKKDLENFFFKNDFEILKKIAEHDSDNTEFINQLISKNLLNFKDTPCKKIDALLNSIHLDKFDRKGHKFITKWFKFTENETRNRKILDNIKNDKISTEFPEGFNDIVDAHLRCCYDIIKELAERFVSIGGSGSPEEILKIKCKFIEYYQSVFNSTTIVCLSTNDPTDMVSDGMWGLYSQSGAGFALQYDLEVLEDFLVRENTALSDFLLGGTKGSFTKDANRAYNYCRILPVTYRKNSPLDFFNSYLVEIKKKIDGQPYSQELISELLDDFFSTKNLKWQHEQEVRFIFHYFSVSALPNDLNHPLTMETFMNNPNAIDDLKLAKKIFCDDKKNIMPFIKPSKIVLGWNYRSANSELYEELIGFAKTHGIEIGYLNETLDYRTDKFIYTLIY